MRSNTYMPIGSLEGHFALVNYGAMIDEGLMATTSDDGHLLLWDLKANKCVHTISMRKGATTCVTSIGNGKFAGSFDDGSIHMWDTVTKKSLYMIKHHDYFRVNHMIMLDPYTLASCYLNIKIWDLRNRSCISILTHQRGLIYYLVQLPDGRLASAQCDGTIKIWNWRKGACVQTIHDAHSSKYIEKLAVFEDGTLVSCAPRDDKIIFWKLKDTLYTKSVHYHKKNCYTIAVWQKNKLLVGVGSNIELIDRAGNILATFSKHESSSVFHVVDCRDGRIAGCGKNKSITIWDATKFWKV